jgi:adenine-specific DNA methylase
VLAIEAPRERKARGAFYTPIEVAQYLADWAVSPTTRRVLEPSAGDGVFLEAVAVRAEQLRLVPEVVGVELVATEAEAARQRAELRGLPPMMQVGDFFSFRADQLGEFDAIVGNPPWIRYHGFKGEQRALALARASEMGVELGGLTSSWAPYLVHAVSFLAPTGRLGMVLPAELLQVDYAADLRRFLVGRFASVRLIAFDRHLFGDAEVDAVLLLASQDGPPGVEFERVSDLGAIGHGVPVPVGGSARWTSAVTSADVLSLLASLEDDGRFIRLGHLGSVDIGVVTGYNDYFLLSDAEAEGFGVPGSDLVPIVSRSDQLADGIVSAAHFATWRQAQRKTWLLTLGRHDPNGAGRYLAEGTRMGVPERYKCRMRKPWYAVPIKAAPDLFLSYMAHETPRMAWNQARSLSTNLIHGVYLVDPSLAGWIASAWKNPVTALSAELEGRTYGGGVLKLETKEAERVLLPRPGAGVGLTDEEFDILASAIVARRAQRLRRSREP